MSIKNFWSARRAAATVVLIALVQPAVARGDLILNGSFESNASGIDGGPGRQVYIFGTNNTGVTGWTLQSSGDVYIHRSPDIGDAVGPNFNFAHNGNQYLDLSGGIGGGSSGSHARIAQSFATVPSTSYMLEFFVGAALTPSPTINVRVDGAGLLLNQTVGASAPGANISWTLQQLLFTADSTITTLSFQGLSSFDDNVSFIDSVSVSAVPEPSSLILVGLTALGLAYRNRRHSVHS